MYAAHVPAELLDRPFTTEQAARHGVTPKMLRGSPWRHLSRDVWAHRDLPDTREIRRQAAALVVSKDAVCCGLTAAWLFGVDVRQPHDIDMRVSFPKGRRPRHRPGLSVCQETLELDDIVVIGGLGVTTPVRTAFDCLRWLGPVEGLVVADALSHVGLVDIEELSAYFASKRRLRNLRRGGAMVPHIEPKTESPMETRMRWRMVSRGLPRPEAQIEVYDEQARRMRRLDLGYRVQRTGVEYDGSLHWEQRREDDRRRDALRAVGWEVLVFSWADVHSTGGDLERQVWRSLRRRGASRG
jgi:very-short-patch-repair endonuclease